MKILQIANGFPPVDWGGVETYTFALSKALRAQGHEVAVFCREAGVDRSRYGVRDEVVDGLPVRFVANRFTCLTSFAERYHDRWIEALFVRWVKEQRPDVLHFQNTHGLSASLLARATEMDAPFTVTLWDYWYMCPQVNLLRPDNRLCIGSHHDVNCYECVYLAKHPPLGRHVPDFDAPLPVVPVPARVAEPRPLGLDDAVYGLMRALLPAPVRRGLLHAYDQLRLRVIPTLRRPFLQLQSPDLTPARIRARYMRETLSACRHIIAPLHFVKAQYVDFGVPEQNIIVVSPGMDVSVWDEARPPLRPIGRGLRFGFIGSLLRHKGIDMMIRAFKMLNAPDTELWIHGFELPNSAFTRQIHDLGDSDPRIHFAGSYNPSELPDILNRLDVLLIPSIWHETFSFVTREAVMAGLPVIASRMGGIPEVIVDGVNGTLLPPNDMDAWVMAMRRLADEPRMVAAFHRAQLERASRVKPIDEHATELVQLYTRVRDELIR